MIMICPRCRIEGNGKFCQNCGQPLMQQNPQQYQNNNYQNNMQQPQYTNTPQYYNPTPVHKKHTALGIVAFILSFLGYLGAVGAFLGIIDIGKDSYKNNKHGLAIASIPIGFVMLIFAVGLSSGSSSQQSNSTASKKTTKTEVINTSNTTVTKTDTSTSSVEATPEPTPEYNLSLTDVLAEFESKGYTTVSMSSDVLYNYGGFYSGWVVHTAFVVEDSDKTTLKCNTESDDSYFYSIVCKFDDQITVKEGESVEVVGIVADPSSIGASTVTLESCRIISTGEKAKETISSLANESELQISNAETVKEAVEKAAEEAARQEKENFKNSCETVKYSDVERNPDSYKDKNIVISGKVIQVSEGWFDSVTLRVEANKGNVWYVTYNRQDGESRILEKDKVTIYGTCSGVTTYTSALGSSITIPSMKAEIIELK